MNALLLWLRAEWDRILGTVLILAGGACLVATYQAVANDRFVAEQLADVASGGLGGLFFVAVGVMLRLQADLHDEWRKLDRIEAALRGEPLPDPSEVMTDLTDVTDVSDRKPATPALQPALIAVGLVLSGAVVALGYHRAADTGDVADATTGLGIGVAGLVFAAVVVGLTQLVGRGRLATRKGHLLGGFLRPAALAAADNGFVLVAPGLTRFHRDGCPTLSRTTPTRLARSDVNGSLSACQICGAS
jgi:hypothetical protein